MLLTRSNDLVRTVVNNDSDCVVQSRTLEIEKSFSSRNRQERLDTPSLPFLIPVFEGHREALHV